MLPNVRWQRLGFENTNNRLDPAPIRVDGTMPVIVAKETITQGVN